MKGFFQDKILFAKLKSQDQAAFLEAYDRYVDKIYRFIFFKVGDAAEAEDLTSATFLKTWQYIGQQETVDEKTLPALLYRIARNVVIDHYRQSNKTEMVSIDEEESQTLVDLKQDPSEAFALKADVEILHKRMKELKDEYREVLIMRFVNELSIAEIAEILEKSKGNVRVLIFRATSALKELMKEEKD
ncbi:RNA polymerase sigma factor [Candidatus Falkowbacteria bacterium]|nr:RNA polymerase sigma factor [Candidatus Falkowbacteria bacterium]